MSLCTHEDCIVFSGSGKYCWEHTLLNMNKSERNAYLAKTPANFRLFNMKKLLCQEFEITQSKWNAEIQERWDEWKQVLLETQPEGNDYTNLPDNLKAWSTLAKNMSGGCSRASPQTLFRVFNLIPNLLEITHTHTINSHHIIYLVSRVQALLNELFGPANEETTIMPTFLWIVLTSRISSLSVNPETITFKDVHTLDESDFCFAHSMLSKRFKELSSMTMQEIKDELCV